ncbi:hypothetical protein CHCC5027_0531 [Bacillus paralicheniformis]|nr:hypothetical protein CHCC5027_0531 [Bacillus paralicheniformis]
MSWLFSSFLLLIRNICSVFILHERRPFNQEREKMTKMIKLFQTNTENIETDDLKFLI